MIAPRLSKIKLRQRPDPIRIEVRLMQNLMLSLIQVEPSSSKFQLRLKLERNKIQVRLEQTALVGPSDSLLQDPVRFNQDRD